MAIMARKIKNLSPSERVLRTLMHRSLDDDPYPEFLRISFSICAKYNYIYANHIL